jgi:hypothetical protein
MKKLLLLSISLLLAACVQQKIARVNLPGLDRSSSVVVQDLRPADEKIALRGSFAITSSSYGISRLGDETLDPSMPRILQHRAWEKLGGSNGTPLEIAIHHMVGYKNIKSEVRGAALGAAIGGAIGGAVGGAASMGATSRSGVNLSQSLVDQSQFEALADEDYQRAYYTEQENPERASVFVIYIDAEIRGKRTFVKTIAPTASQKDQNAYSLAVESAIQYYLSQY